MHNSTNQTFEPGLTPTPVDFGREICGDLYTAEHREWLVTNGIGGFASGTVAGLLTRRYHGLLFAALMPPLGRTLLATKFDETIEYDGEVISLCANRWAGGAIDPHGYRFLERFRLEGTTPVWTFAFADALLEKRIWMQQGANTTFVRYDLIRGRASMKLTVKALVNYRDYHSTTHANGWQFTIEPVNRGVRISAFEGATSYYLFSDSAIVEPTHVWHHSMDLSAERARGLEDHEDHLQAGIFSAELQLGESVTLIASTDSNAGESKRSSREEQRQHERTVLDSFYSAHPDLPETVPAWTQQLILAADQFIVDRSISTQSEGRSVIAGYPWFGDWGRDTMISLPGLTLTTGRPEIARTTLQTFALVTDRGMLPNRFPDAGETPEYNTADATLWFFEAVRQYYAVTQDRQLLREIFPVLEDIIAWHIRGTRFHIQMDPQDGLLYAGEPGVQLTWMDAKVGDWVVTPRIGKPIEVNALWLNALTTLIQFAAILNKPAHLYVATAERVRVNFQRFWNDATGWCFDVIDGEAGPDASLRPNQLFAVSLPDSPLRPEQQRAVVDICARHLLTSFGLRSLAQNDPQYVGRYTGDPRERDAAYHQGTVWGWLIGPFIHAHLRVYKNPGIAATFLAPFIHHVQTHGLGSASEIFDGDPPFTPHGCPAQAWTVAEVLRAWHAIQSMAHDIQEKGSAPPAQPSKRTETRKPRSRERDGAKR